MRHVLIPIALILLTGALALAGHIAMTPEPVQVPGQVQASPLGDVSPLWILAVPAFAVIARVSIALLFPRRYQRASDFEYRDVPVTTPEDVLHLLNSVYGGLVPDSRVQYVVDVDATRWTGIDLRNADELRRRKEHPQITIKRLIVPAEG